jgi:undecaprenyl-diphosphatase
MKKFKRFFTSILLLTAFAVWTMLVCFVDVRPIGPMGSDVGFAALNGQIHKLIGVHMTLYHLTDWLSLIPIGFVFGFALLGLTQWISVKKLSNVDYDILMLGGFYTVTAILYIFFEKFILNTRPVLINGILEASYPSSTTVLVLCVMSTAAMQLQARIKNKALRIGAVYAIILFTFFMILGRLLSGVHWFTDIAGGILLSAALITAYRSLCHFK